MKKKIGWSWLKYTFVSYRAAVTAAIEPGITAIGVQYMFLVIGIVLMSSCLLLWVIQKYGPTWRRRRADLEKVQREE